MKPTILISSCLLGLSCSYNLKKRSIIPQISKILKKYDTIPICPEQLGGLPTPRVKQEIYSSTGLDVVQKKSKVFNYKKEDVTSYFLKGAEESLLIADIYNAKIFIGKSKSPSCGCQKIYDGSFSGTLIDGDGVTTAYLKKKNIKVFSELNLENKVILHEIDKIMS